MTTRVSLLAANRGALGRRHVSVDTPIGQCYDFPNRMLSPSWNFCV